MSLVEQRKFNPSTDVMDGNFMTPLLHGFADQEAYPTDLYGKCTSA